MDRSSVASTMSWSPDWPTTAPGFLATDRPHPQPVKVSGTAGWLSKLVGRLNELGSLEDGWDGNGAKRVSPKAAMDLVQSLGRFMSVNTPSPAILPTPQGGIQLEWHTGGWDIEIEFVGGGRCIYWGQDHRSDTEITGGLQDLGQLRNALAVMTARRLG